MSSQHTTSQCLFDEMLSDLPVLSLFKTLSTCIIVFSKIYTYITDIICLIYVKRTRVVLVVAHTTIAHTYLSKQLLCMKDARK